MPDGRPPACACGDGLAVDADLVPAAEAATAAALAALDGAVPDLASSSSAAPSRTRSARAGARRRAVGAATVLGCSAPGVIGGGRGVELTSAVSVWAARCRTWSLRSFHLEVLRTSESIAVVGHAGACTSTTARRDAAGRPVLVPGGRLRRAGGRGAARAAARSAATRRPARRRARPGCSSTASCTTAARSGWCSAATLAHRAAGQPGLPAGRPDHDRDGCRGQRRCSAWPA